MATEIDAARQLRYRAAWLKQQGLPHSLEGAQAKLFASEIARRQTGEAIQVLGGYGYTKEFPVERYYRDAKVTEIYEGTSEIQRIVIARAILAELDERCAVGAARPRVGDAMARAADEPVRLTRIYTRGGDAGETSLGDGSRVSKLDPRIAAYGTIDELNSVLGVVLAGDCPRELRAPLRARPERALRRRRRPLRARSPSRAGCVSTRRMVDALEALCDRFNEDLPELQSFVLPGGTDGRGRPARRADGVPARRARGARRRRPSTTSTRSSPST